MNIQRAGGQAVMVKVYPAIVGLIAHPHPVRVLLLFYAIRADNQLSQCKAEAS